MSLAGHQQGHLALYFVRDGGDLAGQFMGNYFMGWYSAAIKILKSLLVAGPQASGLAVYLVDS